MQRSAPIQPKTSSTLPKFCRSAALSPTGRRVGHGEVRVVGEGRPADLQRPAEGLALDLRTQLRSLLALFRKYDSKKKFQPTATEIPAINIQKKYTTLVVFKNRTPFIRTTNMLPLDYADVFPFSVIVSDQVNPWEVDVLRALIRPPPPRGMRHRPHPVRWRAAPMLAQEGEMPRAPRRRLRQTKIHFRR